MKLYDIITEGMEILETAGTIAELASNLLEGFGILVAAEIVKEITDRIRDEIYDFVSYEVTLAKF